MAQLSSVVVSLFSHSLRDIKSSLKRMKVRPNTKNIAKLLKSKKSIRHSFVAFYGAIYSLMKFPENSSATDNKVSCIEVLSTSYLNPFTK